jgi:vacuolar-type H+-ATPase subunit H
MRTEHEQTIEILKAREANTVEALRGYIEDLRQRIADAVDAAQRSIRFALKANSSIQCVLASDMDRVIEMLTGNNPEIPDSSNSPTNLEGSP